MSLADIQFVLVLYGMDLASSRTYQTLGTPGAIHLLVCDNTPDVEYPIPKDFNGVYLRQPQNPGLAHSYNLGIREALRNACHWLVTLDQDTTLTTDYLERFQKASERWLHVAEVAAVVPKLLEKDVVQSPHPPLSLKRAAPIPRDFSGFAPDDWSHYNSGAMLRIARIQAIGGFPYEFWLDFLDHATFRLLCADGSKVWVEDVTLEHTLSTNEIPRTDAAYLARKRNIREAENLYYRTFGSPKEVSRYRLRTAYDTAVSIRHLDHRTALHQMTLLFRSFLPISSVSHGGDSQGVKAASVNGHTTAGQS